MSIARSDLARTCGLLVCAGLLLGGCGGKSRTMVSATSTTTSSAHATSGASATPRTAVVATRAELIAQADPVCRKANTELAATSRGKTTAALAAGVVKNETIERRAGRELGALKPPKALAPAYRRMLFIRTSLANRLGELAAIVERSSTNPL